MLSANDSNPTDKRRNTKVMASIFIRAKPCGPLGQRTGILGVVIEWAFRSLANAVRKVTVCFPPDKLCDSVEDAVMNTFVIRPIQSAVADRLREVPEAIVYVADEFPGYPCRECLRDALVGEELILVSHNPFKRQSPYRSSSPIFIHRVSCAENVDASEIPEQLERRQLSVRAFDCDEMMIDAKVIQGSELKSLLSAMFVEVSTSYVDIHNASRGCWSARAQRPDS
jgi:Protein of unknown function (DUF1203)